MSRPGREVANDEEAAGLSNGRGGKFHFSCARTGSFLGGHTTASKKAFGLNAYKSKNLYAVTPHGRCSGAGKCKVVRVRTAHDTIEVDDDARERCASHSGSRAMSDVRRTPRSTPAARGSFSGLAPWM